MAALGLLFSFATKRLAHALRDASVPPGDASAPPGSGCCCRVARRICFKRSRCSLILKYQHTNSRTAKISPRQIALPIPIKIYSGFFGVRCEKWAWTPFH